MRGIIPTFRKERENRSIEYRGLTINELESANYPDSKLITVSIEGSYKNITHSIYFVKEHPFGPYVNISTEPRKNFLKKVSEGEAEKNLKELTLSLRKYTGGQIIIHPFYGAVWGSKSPTIVKDFLVHLKELDGSLGMLIDLSKNGRHNKEERNTARANRLEELWDEEFRKYNVGKFPPLEITHSNVAESMKQLQAELDFEVLEVRTVYKGLSEKEIECSNLPKKKMVIEV